MFHACATSLAKPTCQFDHGMGSSRMKSVTVSSSSSTLMERSANRAAGSSPCSSRNFGSAWMHGAHQVAQTSTSTTLPA